MLCSSQCWYVSSVILCPAGSQRMVDQQVRAAWTGKGDISAFHCTFTQLISFLLFSSPDTFNWHWQWLLSWSPLHVQLHVFASHHWLTAMNTTAICFMNLYSFFYSWRFLILESAHSTSSITVSGSTESLWQQMQYLLSLDLWCDLHDGTCSRISPARSKSGIFLLDGMWIVISYWCCS